MIETRNDFHARVRTLGRKHRAMAKGSTAQLRQDGLIVVRPKRRRTRRRYPLRSFALLIIGFFAFKGFMLASMGDAGYDDRLTRLGEGTALEQVGALVMQPDRVSALFAIAWSGVLRG